MPTIKILNHNIYQKPMGFNTTANEYKSQRAELYIDRVKEYDILCLQECFQAWNPRYSQIIKDLDKNQFHYLAKGDIPKFNNVTVCDSGIIIASKYPIIDSEFLSFEYGVELDAMVNKGILYAKILMPNNKKLHCFNYHAQAFYSKYPPEEKIFQHEV